MSTSELDRQSVPSHIINRELDHAGEAYSRSFYTSMLLEDIGNSVVPYTSHESDVEARLEPEDEEIAVLIARALESRQGRGDLTSALSDFIRSCARRLLAERNVFYEIAYAVDNNEQAGFQLCWIPKGSLRVSSTHVYQEIPSEAAEKLSIPTRIEIDRDRLLQFRLPSSIRDSWEVLMTKLYTLGEAGAVPEFVQESSLMGAEASVPFDISEYDRIKKYVLAEATRQIGWRVRGEFDEWQSGYHQVYRRLKFERFCNELRNNIVRRLNAGLKEAGETLNVTARVDIDGPLTAAELDQLERELQNGTTGLEELMNRLLYS